MPGQIRPDKKLAKMAYRILGTPKELQQNADKVPSKKRLRVWQIDSAATGTRGL